MNCRFCKNLLKHEFIDLVNSPPSNSYLTKEQLNEPEVFYPLKLFICENCFLVQIDEIKKASEIFNHEYAYFSSFSTSWLNHARNYVGMITKRFNYDDKSQVMELASNDGYLLQYFQKKNIPVLGIEPSKNVARIAQKKGIETIVDFFGVRLAKKLMEHGRGMDLIIGNNVFAHVPDVNDFIAGVKIALNQGGVITLEFPHLMQLIEKNQFDTIYHEHFSYFSLYTASLILMKNGLEIFDVEQIPTHGGSLRIYGKHNKDETKKISPNVVNLLEEEQSKKMKNLEFYSSFQLKIDKVKINLLSFLLEQKEKSKIVAAYGAAAKGNTLLNYCGISNDLIKFVVDASIYKQGKYLPGSHIPIVQEEMIKKIKPDYIIILPWNLKNEIKDQLDYVQQWGAKLVLPIPKLEIL